MALPAIASECKGDNGSRAACSGKHSYIEGNAEARVEFALLLRTSCFQSCNQNLPDEIIRRLPSCLSLFNVVVLLIPPQFVADWLELMALPFEARMALILAVVLNIALSFAYEQWGTQTVARIIGWFFQLRRQRRTRDGKAYKSVEGGMR